MVELALGRDPRPPHREGPQAVAAKWFVRRSADGVVRRVPTHEEIARVERAVGDCVVEVTVEPGERLSERHDQDSYSYAIANIHVGGASEDELTRKYEQAVAALPFDIEDRSETGRRNRLHEDRRPVPARGRGRPAVDTDVGRNPPRGAGLAAGGPRRPVPAMLEFMPYRQRDLTAVRDSMHHPYLAGHGFAGVRVDLRGSGDSEGVLTDEYLDAELATLRRCSPGSRRSRGAAAGPG